MTSTPPAQEAPLSLPASLDDVALFLDIDGTLIDIALTPDSVVVPTDLPPLLAALGARAGGALALLTGRDLVTVDRLFAPFQLPVGAVHGAMVRDTAGKIVADPPHPDLPLVQRRLEAYAATHPALLVEEKGTAVAIHFRLAPELAPAAEAVVRAALAEAGPGLTVQPGKMVFEVRPAVADKGTALAAFMRDRVFQGRRPIAIGDDLTDESMFRAAVAAGGLAYRVGPPLPKGVASVAVPAFAAPAEVRGWLAALV
jgi:trehalose 6-phosphate phosphatase